jgi:anti-anti-sigma regulatory factor
MPPRSLHTKLTWESHTPVLHLPSGLGIETEESFGAAVDQALARTPSTLIIDFSTVKQANTAGIGLIVDLLRRSWDAGMTVAFAAITGQPALIIERVGLMERVPSFDSVAGALEALREGREEREGT